jgi:hypothetical protein
MVAWAVPFRRNQSHPCRWDPERFAPLTDAAGNHPTNVGGIMNILTTVASAARTALVYITVGSVMIVWSVIYYFYLNSHPPTHSDAAWYWCTGFLLTGCTLLIIGLAVGWIGRAARQADQPHIIVTTRDAQGQPSANVVPLANNAVMAPSSTAPLAVPNNPAIQQPAAMPQVPPPTR